MPFVALFCWGTEPGGALLAGELHVAAPPALHWTQDPSFFRRLHGPRVRVTLALGAWTPIPPSPNSNSIFFPCSVHVPRHNTFDIAQTGDPLDSTRITISNTSPQDTTRAAANIDGRFDRPKDRGAEGGRGPGGHIAGFGLVRVGSGGLPLFLAACHRLQMRAPAANPWASLWRRQADSLSTRRPAPAATPPLNLPYHMARPPPRARFGWSTDSSDEAPPPDARQRTPPRRMHNVTTLAGSAVCIPMCHLHTAASAARRPRSRDPVMRRPFCPARLTSLRASVPTQLGAKQ